jgi:Flp pilus assembly protein TadD
MTFWRRTIVLAALFACPAVTVAAQDAPVSDYALIGQAIEGGRLMQARTMLANRIIAERGSENGSAELDILSAQLALAERRDDQALVAFSNLDQRGITDCRVQAGLGLSLMRQQKAGQALNHLRAAAKACPKDWRTWNALGVTLDLAGDWRGSAEAYEAAFRLTDNRATIMNNYGFSLLLQRRFTEAGRLFAQAARAEPGNQRYVNNSDIARAMAGEPLARAGRDDPDRQAWARRLNNAGYASLLAGRTDEAKAYFSRSLHSSDDYFERASANLSAMAGGQ